MTKIIKLYNAGNIDTLVWPNTVNANYAKRYLVPMLKNGVTAYITNVRTTLLLLVIDDLFLPVTINTDDYTNSYVCSPYTHYITYAIEELKTLKQPSIELLLCQVIKLLGMILKFGKINQVVHVNNWLLSTNLYPTISAEQIQAITQFLTQAYPKHTIIFRSINNYAYANLNEKFLLCGYQLVASRQVYFLAENLIKGKAKWLIKKDFKLLDASGYALLDASNITSDDIPRILELYNYLYLDKYSLSNPQFTPEFIALALKNNTLTLKAFKKNGRIDAVLGYFCRNNIMTTPLFGYDITLPSSTGLYRMLSAQLIRESQQLGLLLHQSSGAASFKRCRASVGSIEYNAVNNTNSPLLSKFCWSLLAMLINGLGARLLKKYKL